ncbi:guanylate kinase [Chloroflexota bacterium]
MKIERQTPLNQPARPLLIVLSGLSGAGKDAVLNRMKESGCSIKHVTTVTTRPKRANEKTGVDYYFTSKENFQEMIARDELLEWAKVYDNYYGVPRNPIKQALAEGQDVVVKVDVQGVATIKKILPQAAFIFLTPPVTEEALLRLKKRSTESPTELVLRTKTAEEEIKQLHLFDYIVFNRQGETDRAVADILTIINAEKCRVTPREIAL